MSLSAMWREERSAEGLCGTRSVKPCDEVSGVGDEDVGTNPLGVLDVVGHDLVVGRVVGVRVD